MAVQIDKILKTNTITAEYIKRRADGNVDGSVAGSAYTLYILHGSNAAGIGRRDRGMPGKEFNQLLVNAHAFSFHINGMNEEFVAESGQVGENLPTDPEVGELLPAVRYDVISVILPPTTQIKDQSGGTYLLGECAQSFSIKGTVVEYPGGDNDMGGAAVEPVGCIILVDPSADL